MAARELGQSRVWSGGHGHGHGHGAHAGMGTGTGTGRIADFVGYSPYGIQMFFTCVDSRRNSRPAP